MNTRVLGSSGFEVSAVGYGCMGLSHAHGYAMEQADAVRVVREAVEAGYTYFDTSGMYTGVTRADNDANNELVVGEALEPVRDQVTIATKFGVKIGAGHAFVYDSSETVIRKTVETSLRQLRTDHLDILYQARRDERVSPEELAGVVGDLIKEGKVLAWGISEVTDPDYLRRAHAVTPVAVIQNKLNMANRDTEKLFPVLEELGIAATTYTPLMKGFLTAPADIKHLMREGDDFRRFIPQYSEKGVAEAAPLYALLEEYSQKHECTWTQLCLAWILNKRPYLVPIPGTTNPARMRENLAAADIILTPEEMADIDARLDEMHPERFGQQ